MPGSYHYSHPRLDKAELRQRVALSAHKLTWLRERGWNPHYYQLLALTDRDPETKLMTRFKHLVAGRRGGKTEGAAYDTAYYMANPAAWWWDFKGVENDEPLWMWALSKNHKIGRPSLLTFRKTLVKLGLVYDKDYKENKGDKFFEFADGSLLEFKSADDPESLRGAGLHRLWIDEAAFIPNADAWNVVSPALSDNEGDVVTTTTPKGKNWFYEEFFTGQSLEDDQQMRVEYMSVHNPYFPEREWLRQKRVMHPMMFKQEYMAAFDSMAGIELHGDWLHFYGADEDTPAPERNGNTWPTLDVYLGVDPAISQSDRADRFVMSLVGIEKDRSKAYLLKQWAGRLPFPEQVEKINEWYIQYRPQIVGIESTAYQAALVQQTERLPNFVPVVPMITKGKKEERIIGMSPFFKIGKVLISRDHTDFIDEWISYDTSIKNPKDDCLDSVEIALRTAGALLPFAETPALDDRPITDIQEIARMRAPSRAEKDDYDYAMGDDW